jgi:hypothetical protein
MTADGDVLSIPIPRETGGDPAFPRTDAARAPDVAVSALPCYAQPVYGPGCYWASEPVYDVAGRFVGYTGRPLQVCPGYVAPPPPGAAGLRCLLRPRQNDRVSRRIKSQRSSDKPAWDNALLHRARDPKFCRRVASAPRLQGRNHSLICRPVMNACGSRHPAMTNAIKEIIRTM